MPATSKAMYRFMQMLAHNPQMAAKKGMSADQAAEFVGHNKGKMAYKDLPNKKRTSKTLTKMK